MSRRRNSARSGVIRCCRILWSSVYLSVIPHKLRAHVHAGDGAELWGTSWRRSCSAARGGDGKAKKGAKSGAAWGGCVLLFSDKKQTSPLYKSLAAQYAGKLAFAEVCVITLTLRSDMELSCKAIPGKEMSLYRPA